MLDSARKRNKQSLKLVCDAFPEVFRPQGVAVVVVDDEADAKDLVSLQDEVPLQNSSEDSSAAKGVNDSVTHARNLKVST